MKISSKNIWKPLFLAFVMISVSACGVVKRGTIPWEEESPSTPPEEVTYTTPTDDSPENLDNIFTDDSEPIEIQEMQSFLQLAYADWKGTPYLFGGSGNSGIDCSAFMRVVFEDYLTKNIPRTTREQMEKGVEIDQSQVQTGDLVFFKTGRRSFHVGVMVNRGEFLHASTSEGVKISDLSHPYWQENWLTARRLF